MIDFALHTKKKNLNREQFAVTSDKLNLVKSGNNRPKTFARLRQAKMICPGPLEIYPAPYLFLSKLTRKVRKRKKRKVKENEAKKEAPTKKAENINTTIYTN